jgi:hypothetical protein
MSDSAPMSGWQRHALQGAEVLWGRAERAIRWRSSPGSVPPRLLAQVAGRLFLEYRYPRVHRTLTAVQIVSKSVLAPALTQGTASRALERALARRPEETILWLARAETLVRATRLLHREKWRLHLSDVELRSLNLDGGQSELLGAVVMARASLVDVRFFGYLGAADFEGALLDESTFIGSHLARASFEDASMRNVVLAGCDLLGCSFERARISRCTFSDVDLRRSSFKDAEVEDVIFERCNFEGVEGGKWENVDFVDCRNLGDDLPTSPGGGEDEGARTALGALPRPVVREHPRGGDDALVVRYSRAGNWTPPPFGYRLQTLARQVTAWIALGSSYHEVRSRVANDPLQAMQFPKRRWLAVLRILLGVAPDRDTASVAALVYRLQLDGLRARRPEVEAVSFPQLVLVDGDRPAAHYVEAGGDRYVVINRGLEVMAIRLARYCIAWVLPQAISYMDSWVETEDTDVAQAALEERLADLVLLRGDVSGLGRLQVTGMRDMQATQLAMTFLAFVLGHELAHFMRSAGLLAASTEADPEVQADVDAIRLLATEEELDGDEMLAEALREADPAMLREGLQLAASELGAPEETGDEIAAMSIDELREEVASEVTRFADCDWKAAAVAAFILIFGGSVGYRGDPDLMERITRAVRGGLGEDAARELEEEFARDDSALSMLRRVFYAASPPG